MIRADFIYMIHFKFKSYRPVATFQENLYNHFLASDLWLQM